MEERKMRPRPRRSRRKVCKFCVEKATGIDYKDIKKLTGHVRCLRRASARSGRRDQAGPRNGSAALRRGKILRESHTFIDSRPFSTAPFFGRALFFYRNQKSTAALFIIYWLFLFRPRGIMGG